MTHNPEPAREAVREAVHKLFEAGEISCWMDEAEHVDAFQKIAAALSALGTEGRADG